jgi:hypothetical protein
MKKSYKSQSKLIKYLNSTLMKDIKRVLLLANKENIYSFSKKFQIKLDEKSKMEFEIGPLASFLFDTKNSIRVAPIIAGRIKILRGENFIMYIGTSYSFGINALGLLYGTGTSF